jgi:hypothetical protein
MEAAMKLGRQYYVDLGQPQRVNFIAREGSYHGTTLGALSYPATSSDARNSFLCFPTISTGFPRVMPTGNALIMSLMPTLSRRKPRSSKTYSSDSAQNCYWVRLRACCGCHPVMCPICPRLPSRDEGRLYSVWSPIYPGRGNVWDGTTWYFARLAS